MADHQYLSIGEVLGLLLEDFPDVTISKIRFLESQGLIEPERTPSGYRKFYDNDVELLRAILHEQKANFLPLKVIRDRIESGAIEGDPTGGRTPPRGIRNVEQAQRLEGQQRDAEARDSVFRRTDGGPEWAGGHALIPGEAGAALLEVGALSDGSSAPITAAVPVTPSAPPKDPTSAGRASSSAPVTVLAAHRPAAGPGPEPREHKPPTTGVPGPPIDQSPGRDRAPQRSAAPDSEPGPAVDAESGSSPAPAQKPESAQPAESTVVVPPSPMPPSPQSDSPAVTPRSAPAGSDRAREFPYNRDELCAAAGITVAQLAGLEDYGIITSRGSGVDTSFQPDAVEIARIAGQLLGQGIDARHLRAWRQAAERESALFEQRIMPLLRQRNPHARQSALNSLSELSDLGARLHDALVESLLRHHFDGG